jgi:hypothetical protein
MPVPPGTRGSHPLLRPQQDIRPGVQHEIADEPQAPKLRRKIGSILQSIIQGAYPGERLKECAEPASAPCGDESPSRHRAWLKPVASRESGTCVLRFTAMRLEPNAAPVARGRFHNRFQSRDSVTLWSVQLHLYSDGRTWDRTRDLPRVKSTQGLRLASSSCVDGFPCGAAAAVATG